MTATDPRPNRFPLFLSGLVCPGVGQFAQRRWAAAFLFAVSFIGCFVLFGIAAFRILRIFYAMGLGAGKPGGTDLPVGMLVSSLAGALLVYVAGLVDTYVAYLRQSTQWRRRELEEGSGSGKRSKRSRVPDSGNP